jgi:hypothetical protein
VLFDEDKPSLVPSKGVAFISNEHSLDLPCLRDVPVHIPPLHISHMLSLCNIGLVPILEGHLRAGGIVTIF